VKKAGLKKSAKVVLKIQHTDRGKHGVEGSGAEATKENSPKKKTDLGDDVESLKCELLKRSVEEGEGLPRRKSLPKSKETNKLICRERIRLQKKGNHDRYRNEKPDQGSAKKLTKERRSRCAWKTNRSAES
jgi:hypothetical protein